MAWVVCGCGVLGIERERRADGDDSKDGGTGEDEIEE
jgi:hypothetical protein